jgi:hypothetical protein
LGHNVTNCPSQEFGPGWNKFQLQFAPHKKVIEQVDQDVDEFTTSFHPVLKVKGELLDPRSDMAFRDRWSIEARGKGISGFFMKWKRALKKYRIMWGSTKSISRDWPAERLLFSVASTLLACSQSNIPTSLSTLLPSKLLRKFSQRIAVRVDAFISSFIPKIKEHLRTKSLLLLRLLLEATWR